MALAARVANLASHDFIDAWNKKFRTITDDLLAAAGKPSNDEVENLMAFPRISLVGLISARDAGQIAAESIVKACESCGVGARRGLLDDLDVLLVELQDRSVDQIWSTMMQGIERSLGGRKLPQDTYRIPMHGGALQAGRVTLTHYVESLRTKSRANRQKFILAITMLLIGSLVAKSVDYLGDLEKARAAPAATSTASPVAASSTTPGVTSARTPSSSSTKK